jgi:hypothetical protein
LGTDRWSSDTKMGIGLQGSIQRWFMVQFAWTVSIWFDQSWIRKLRSCDCKWPHVWYLNNDYCMDCVGSITCCFSKTRLYITCSWFYNISYAVKPTHFFLYLYRGNKFIKLLIESSFIFHRQYMRHEHHLDNTLHL